MRGWESTEKKSEQMWTEPSDLGVESWKESAAHCTVRHMEEDIFDVRE